MGTVKPHSSGPIYSSTVIVTLAFDGTVTFGTAMIEGPGPWALMDRLLQSFRRRLAKFDLSSFLC